MASRSRAPTSQETHRQEKLSIHTAGILCRKGKKTKTLHPLASKRIFLLCETGREKSSRFLLLCLIDINMKYSGVVLIRLGFPARVRGGALLLDQNIFSKNILLESSLLPPPFLLWLQRHSSMFWGAAPTLNSPLPCMAGWPTGQPGGPSQEAIFSRSGIWLIGSHTSSCAGSRAGRGLSCLGCCLALTLRHHVLSPHPSPSCHPPLKPHKGGDTSERLSPLPLASQQDLTLETYLNPSSSQLDALQVVSASRK